MRLERVAGVVRTASDPDSFAEWLKTHPATYRS
jgi:hypothetical protein